jgi:hypothetical protein
VATIVTYEITGNVNVQRLPGIYTQTSRGLGLGDLNYDNQYTASDINAGSGFEQVLYSQNGQFNPAGDLNADGKVNNFDLFALPARYLRVGANAAAAEARNAVLRRGNINHQSITDASDIDALYLRLGTTTDLWFDDLNVDGLISKADVDLLVQVIFQSQYGDVSLDGIVDTIDFNVLAANFGRFSGAGWASGDINGDRAVDTTDFNLLASNFGFQYTAGGAAAALVGVNVPEPSVIGMMLIAGGCLLARRRGR